MQLKQYIELKEIELVSICINKAEDKLLVSLNNS